MIEPTLYARCRDARRAKAMTPELIAGVMDACGRPALAAIWRQDPPPAVAPMPYTGLEYFIREAKRHQANVARAHARQELAL